MIKHSSEKHPAKYDQIFSVFPIITEPRRGFRVITIMKGTRARISIVVWKLELSKVKRWDQSEIDFLFA